MQSDRFTLSFEPEEIAAENEPTINSDLIVYPNPSKGQITLSYVGQEQLSTATITDVNGKLIKEIDLRSFDESLDIDLSGLSKGMYFMQISTSNTVITKKILLK